MRLEKFFSYKCIKRILDVLFSSVACILTFFVVAPLVTVIIFFEDQSPPIFRQKRIGFNGVPFYIYKFRTMLRDADKKRNAAIAKTASGLIQSASDPRVTKIGKLLRKTSIDELPQFFNVLRGEMSLVGPRPLIHDDVRQLSDRHMKRFEVLPGITGYAQINGRSYASIQKRENNDLYYVENMSFKLDTKIILKTLIVVLNKNIVC